MKKTNLQDAIRASRKAAKKKREQAAPAGNDPAAEMRRHKRKCMICRHPEREEIEQEYVDWEAARKILKRHKLSSERSLLRHMQAMGLHLKRRKRLQTVLDRILERVGEVRVTAGAVVSAVRTQADLSSRGRWVEAPEMVYLGELYNRMTREETERYFREGRLPDWFLNAVEPATTLARMFEEEAENEQGGRPEEPEGDDEGGEEEEAEEE